MEKIKVNLSFNTYNLLLHDMESFCFSMKEDQPNKNLFYNTICKEMYKIKKAESVILRNKLENIIQNEINDINIVNNILDNIEDLYNYKMEDKTNRSHGYYISFRPLQSLMSMYEEIEEFELRDNTISNYYRNLFNDYARLPQDERERIIFSDQIKVIESAIKNKKTIQITYGHFKHEIIPYQIVRTNDELYNYLICGINKKGIIKYLSLHIYKCANVIKTKNSFILTSTDEKNFKELIQIGPRNIERRTALCKIKLDKKGKKYFKQFYLNRPIPISIEDDIYTFNTSTDELLTYFSRFGSSAEIIEPINLRNQMINFHKHAYNKYSK